MFRDRAIALPPLNTTLARRTIEQTEIYQALKGVRGRPPVDLAALDRLLVRFGQLVVEQRWIDACQRQGLGTEMLRRLVQVGRDERLDRITAEMLPVNLAMRRVADRVGFRLTIDPTLVTAEIAL